MLPKYCHFLHIFKKLEQVYNQMDVSIIAYKVLIWDSEQKAKS